MLKVLFGFLLGLVFISVVAISLTGIVPGLSSLVGAGPKDLGIKNITKESSQKAQDKIGTQIITLPKDTPIEKGYKLEGKKPVDIEMDSQELTSLASNRSWSAYPIKSIQIRINSDGSVDSSGVIIVSKALPYATALGYTTNQIKEAMSKYNIPQVEFPFYLHGTGSVSNNKVSMNVATFKVGSIPLPQSILGQAQKEAVSVLEDLLNKNSHSVNYEYVKFESGKVKIKGQVAEKQYIIGN